MKNIYLQYFNQTSIKKISVFILLVCISISFHIGAQEKKKDHKLPKLDYSIDITVQTIPFYALDKNGKPVYDLKQEEIDFFLKIHSL